MSAAKIFQQEPDERLESLKAQIAGIVSDPHFKYTATSKNLAFAQWRLGMVLCVPDFKSIIIEEKLGHTLVRVGGFTHLPWTHYVV